MPITDLSDSDTITGRQPSASTPLPVMIVNGASKPIPNSFAAGEGHLGEVGGRTVVANATFTRPNDTNAYASGDLVANNTVAGSVAPMQFTVARIAAGSGLVRRARLKKSGTTVTNASFRLHLYATAPTPTNGDNGVWLTTHSAYLGSLDLDLSGGNGRVFSDSASVIGTPAVGSEINFALASGQLIYGLLEARGAYTPVAQEVFTADLEVLQN